jgi:Zn-dependent protease
MFFSTPRTAYDLRFSLFGIPVTISPFFWVMCIVLGFDLIKVEPGGPANLVAWTVAVFISILIHEFGHGLTMKAFGHRSEITLYHFGGFASSRSRGMERPFRSLLISAAGPGASFALFLVVLGISLALIRSSFDWAWLLDVRFLRGLQDFVPIMMARAGLFRAGTPVFFIVWSLLYINFFWMLINLLPVLPLDGGNMLRSFLAMLGVRDSSDWALKVGVAVGAAVAVFFLLQMNFFIGIMFAYMAVQNYRTLQSQRYGTY